MRWMVLVLGLTMALAGIGCGDDSDDGPTAPGGDDDTTSPGIPVDQLEVNEGTVGVVIDVRQVVRWGYDASRVEIDLDDEFARFSGELDVNPETSVASFRVSRDSLSTEQIETLAQGVPVSIVVRDDQETELATYDGPLPLDSSGQLFAVSTTLPRIYPQVSIVPGQPYIIQALEEGSPVDGHVWRLSSVPGPSQDIEVQLDPEFVPDRLDEYRFGFEATALDDVYLIYYEFEDSGPFYLRNDVTGLKATTEDVDPQDPNWQFQFRIERDENARIRLTSGGGTNFSTGLYGEGSIHEAGGDEYLPFRAFAANVEWDVQDLGTRFEPPIVPPARLDFAYRSVLSNCSPGELTETIGNLRSETRTTTVGTEESLELYSSSENSVSVTTGLEVGGAFKAISASASVDVTNSFTYTTSTTQTSTNTWEQSDSFTQEVSSQRQITVPPFTGVEAYDSIATFDNVRMPFVQRLRVRGSYDGVAPLTGDQIVSQLMANQFGGVVSNVGSDFVDITIRGSAEIANYYEAYRGVVEVPGICD